MKITIITVVFNSHDTIEETICSMLKQDYPDKEYIIIDGGSDDGTWDIILRYKNQIGKVVSEKDGGIYDAMNKGIGISSGEIIGILNSGDIYLNNEILGNIMEEFTKTSELDILYGDMIYVKRFDTATIVRHWVSSDFNKDFFEKGHVPPHPALFVRKKVYAEAGLYDLKYRFASDYDWMLRIFKKFHYKSKYHPYVMVKMRLGGVTNNSLKNIISGNIEIYDSWKNNGLKAPLLLMPRRLIKRLKQFKWNHTNIFHGNLKLLISSHKMLQ